MSADANAYAGLRRRLRAPEASNAPAENGRDAIPAAGQEGVVSYPVVGSGPSRGCASLARLAHDLLLKQYLNSEESKELSASMREKRRPDSETFGH